MCLILIKGYDLGVDGDDSFEVYISMLHYRQRIWL